MTVEEEAAWRRRIEWKLDRLGYHVTLLSLAQRRPLLPSLPPLRRRSPLWPVLLTLLLHRDNLAASVCSALRYAPASPDAGQ
jgi:hypothetical protein